MKYLLTFILCLTLTLVKAQPGDPGGDPDEVQQTKVTTSIKTNYTGPTLSKVVIWYIRKRFGL